MTHLVSREPWGVVDLDTEAGSVFIQEDWHYQWKLWQGVTRPWTLDEKQATHTAIDRQIWSIWSYRLKLRVSGTTDFARRFAAVLLPVNFDVRWDIHPPAHWTVTVWKMPPGVGPTTHRSHVKPAGNTIELNTADLSPRAAANNAGNSTSDFLTAPHEFGHTVGAPNRYLRDEYVAGAAKLGDTNSLLNVGRELRDRHVHEVLATLQRLVPGSHFTSNLPP